ncbi:hypothetical protein M8494_24165 [Serratia ureilytica]
MKSWCAWKSRWPKGINGLNKAFLRTLKRKGFADARLAVGRRRRERNSQLRHSHGLHPVYKRVDTCAAEFATDTAYMYPPMKKSASPTRPTTGRK